MSTDSTSSFKETVSEMWRDRIIQGAAQVFAAKGFHKASTRQIAEAAGVAEGTIYNYFKNKRALLFALLEKVSAQPIKDILLNNPPDDPRQFFRLLIKDRYQFYQSNGDLLAPIMAEVFTDPQLRDELHQQVFKPAIDLMEQYLQSRVDTNDFRPISTMIVAYGITGAVALNTVFKFSSIDPRYGDISEDELSDELIDWFMRGLASTQDAS